MQLLRYLTSSIFPHTVAQIHTHTNTNTRARWRSPYRSPTRSSQNPGDGEHRLTRERGMKTECWKKWSAGGKVAGWRTSFVGIKLCIFSSLLIDQLPQDISMPNQRPAASVYSVLRERRLNQTHFSKEKLYLLYTTVCEGKIRYQSCLVEQLSPDPISSRSYTGLTNMNQTLFRKTLRSIIAEGGNNTENGHNQAQ